MSWRVLYTESDSLLRSSSRPWTPTSRSISTSSSSSESTAFDPAAEDRFLGIADIPSEVDNKGSTARDFYATERNFLSWFRFGLAIMATGMAALTDFNGSRNSFPDNLDFSRFYYWLSDFVDQHTMGLGLLLFFLAAVTIVAALASFAHAHAQLAVRRRPLRWSGGLLTALALVVAVTTTVVAISALLSQKGAN